jgi:hypothetical protein
MRTELLHASMWVVAKWFERFVDNSHPKTETTGLADFGAFEANLAEATVLDHGAEFVLQKWGAEIGMLCGGDHRGDRLSNLPQPSRSQLRRVCVRAMASRAPAVQEAIWVVHGRIWECTIMALPATGDRFALSRILIALLFAPHASLRICSKTQVTEESTARTIIPCDRLSPQPSEKE